MLHRSLLTVVGSLALVLAAPAQDANLEREEVLALSRRIDAYIARKCAEAGVVPAPRAEDTVYFRRLYLDLAGKIPSLLDSRDFVQNPDPDKRWFWTEQLLASEGHRRHMSILWRSIILGNATNQQARFLTPAFEAWLREQFDKNVGLDTLTRSLLTASGTMNNAFVRGGQQPGPSAFFFAAENKPENLATSTSRAFLGIKLDCAQCHAHPFASWTREQFWELAAFFVGTPAPAPRPGAAQFVPGTAGGRQIQIPNTNKTVKARFLTGAEPKWEAASDSRKVLVDWIVTADNPYFARAMADHLWTYLMGSSLLDPIVEPADDGRIAHAELLDDLAQQLALHRFDMRFLLRAIVHSEAYQRTSAGKAIPEEYQLFARRAVRGLIPEQIFANVAEATDYQEQAPPPGAMVNVDVLNAARTPRGEFLAKFPTQDPRDEPQVSILQALFLMNGKFLSDRVKPENNGALQILAVQPTSNERRVETLYLMVLSRAPRPEELERMVRYMERRGDNAQALSDVYWALLNSAEFLLNH
jgi:hypothetical protein